MIELKKEQFAELQNFIQVQNKDFPFINSIIEGFQFGRIFVNYLKPDYLLFWHYNGFAIIIGSDITENDLTFILSLIQNKYESNQRRFALIVPSMSLNRMLFDRLNETKEIKIYNRQFFNFDECVYLKNKYTIPKGFIVKELDRSILSGEKIKNFTNYAWTSIDEYLKYGKGVCLINDNNIACIAFSTFVNREKIEISIETNERYRKQGLAFITASIFISSILRSGHIPVWSCLETNQGSFRLAEKLGFIPTISLPVFELEAEPLNFLV